MNVEDPADQMAEPREGDVLPDPGATDDAAVREHHRPGRFVPVGLFLTGLFIAAVGVGAAAVRTSVRGTTVYWGVALVLVTLAVCVRAGAWTLGSRRGAALVGTGWALLTLVFATVNPGGDVLLPDVRRTYVYLVGGVVVTLVAALWPLPRGTRGFVMGTDHAGPGDRAAAQIATEASPVEASLLPEEPAGE